MADSTDHIDHGLQLLTSHILLGNLRDNNDNFNVLFSSLLKTFAESLPLICIQLICFQRGFYPC